jgi:hypothetical protein
MDAACRAAGCCSDLKKADDPASCGAALRKTPNSTLHSGAPQRVQDLLERVLF